MPPLLIHIKDMGRELCQKSALLKCRSRLKSASPGRDAMQFELSRIARRFNKEGR